MFVFNSSILYSLSGKDNQLVAGAVGLAAILTTTAVYYAFSLSSKDREHEFPKLPGIQLFHAWEFFHRRYGFIQSNAERNPEGFSFNVLHHKVISLAGEDARQAFLFDPHMSLFQGYTILSGGIPLVSNVDIATEESEEGNVNIINRKLNKILNRTRLQNVLPTLLQDAIDTADKWDNSNRIEPFTDIYYLVFLMTARMITCRELTKNEGDLRRIIELFQILEIGATPAALLLPWLPSSSRRTVKKGSTELFILLSSYVEARREEEPTSDAIDVFIAEGETTQSIVGFIMTTLFAGITNTGIISCWMLIDLAVHPEWKEKCKKEIQEVLSRYSGSSIGTLHEKLEALPVSAWEEEFPILDACIRETQRLSLTGALLRRNVRGKMKIGGRIVKRGDFIAYLLGDVHLNPEYYPEPSKYNPGRWLEPGSLPDAAHTFLGWGAGRHPCSGMKVAKLEMKLILVMFLTRYEYQLVDKDGKFPDPLPVPNRNDTHKASPLGPKCYFDIKKIME